MVTAGSGGSGMLLGFVSELGDTQTCRGLAASCRRHDVVNEAISQHRLLTDQQMIGAITGTGAAQPESKCENAPLMQEESLLSAPRLPPAKRPFRVSSRYWRYGQLQTRFRRRASGRSGYLYGGILSPNYTIDHTYTVPGSFLTVRQPMVVGWGRSRCASLKDSLTHG